MRSIAPMVVAASIGVGLCWLGCGGEDHPATVPTGTVPTGTTTGPDCSKPTEGCACPAPGGVDVCKKVRVSGSYVSCSNGTITCGADGHWGPCIGDGIWVHVDAGPSDALAD
jgi:hypothetical protein